MSKLIDLTGQKFGRLTVIKKCNQNKGRHVVWLCDCDCGTKNYPVIGNNLKRGLTRSCGCYKKETIIKRCSGHNTYKIKEAIVIMEDNKHHKFIFDLEDLEKVLKFYWKVDVNGRVVGHDDKHDLKLSRYLMDCKYGDNIIIDHINHNPLDNRKINLRKVNSCQNMQNASPTRNKSGHVGVNWCTRKNKWMAKITVNRKKIFLGYFDNFQDAVKIREEAEEKYHGEYSFNKSELLVDDIMEKIINEE